MSLTRALAGLGVVAALSLTAACGADDEPAAKPTSRLTMSADNTEAPAASRTPQSAEDADGPAAVARAAVKAMAEKDYTGYCALFDAKGEAPTTEQVEDCATFMDGVFTDDVAAQAKAALKAGPSEVFEAKGAATVTYKGLGSEKIDLVLIDGTWYATNG
ncbi:hypothetical protein [Nocardioides yefusunii]|uniref:Lipoprotein n=1 Tax=Nocardioides yefusunii TaxID=2500546 RepID=A0ABW1QZC0_9ACTN|nr:hypothetical protein [Nocardioides yefusunii]